MEHFEAKQSPRAEFTARCFNTSACNPGAALQCCVPQNPCPQECTAPGLGQGPTSVLRDARLVHGGVQDGVRLPAGRAGRHLIAWATQGTDRQHQQLLCTAPAGCRAPSQHPRAPPSTPEHPAQRMVATVRRTTASGHFRPGQAPW